MQCDYRLAKWATDRVDGIVRPQQVPITIRADCEALAGGRETFSCTFPPLLCLIEKKKFKMNNNNSSIVWGCALLIYVHIDILVPVSYNTLQ